jgi:hypothetical protein
MATIILLFWEGFAFRFSTAPFKHRDLDLVVFPVSISETERRD